jgi:hypothetical protein
MFLKKPTRSSEVTMLVAEQGKTLVENKLKFPFPDGLWETAVVRAKSVNARTCLGALVPEPGSEPTWEADPRATLQDLHRVLTSVLGKKLEAVSLGKLSGAPASLADLHVSGLDPQHSAYVFWVKVEGKKISRGRHTSDDLPPVEFTQPLLGRLVFLRLAEGMNEGQWVALTQSGCSTRFTGTEQDYGFLCEESPQAKAKRAREATGQTPEKDKATKVAGLVRDDDKANILREAEALLDLSQETAAESYAEAEAYCQAKNPDWWAGKRKALVARWEALHLRRHQEPVVAFDLDELDYQRQIVDKNYPLLPWQKAVFEALRQAPRERRLRFVEGMFSVGKSTFTRMLQDPGFWASQGEPHRGALNVTNIVKLDDFVMKYGTKGFPGTLVFDLPRHSQSFSAKQLDLLEEYTNTGNPLEGVKYEGGTVVMRSHVLVFSNHPPPEGILHKKVYHLRLLSKDQVAEELTWEMPGQQEDGSFNTAALEKELHDRLRADPLFRVAFQRVAAKVAADGV